jgi:hypothetical protein
VQQDCERHRRQDLTELPEHPDPLRELREQPPAEPVREQPDDRDEGHRVAGADEDPRHEDHGERVREGQQRLAARHQQGTGHDEGAWSDAIDEHADGDLEGCVNDDLNDDDGREGRSCDIESLGRIHAQNAERGPLCHRNDVGEHRAAENHP